MAEPMFVDRDLALDLLLKGAIDKAVLAERAACDRILCDMQAEAPAYLQGQADALAWCRAEWGRHHEPIDFLDALEGRRKSLSLPVAAENARVRAGTFEADISAAGMGSVTLDGRPVPASGFTLRCAVGELPDLNVDFAPVALNLRTDGTPSTTRDR